MLSLNAYAITSATIALATVKAALNTSGHCLNYKIEARLCMWESPEGVPYTTPYLNHYLPDVVVVVYRNNSENPWTEANALIDFPASKLQALKFPNVGGGNLSMLDVHEQDIIFKEADVIGNPGVQALPQQIPFILLTSLSTPMLPYFQSMADSFLWRGIPPYSTIEELSSVKLGIAHTVGTGLNNWGSVYPHQGFVAGNNDAKASMVIAERAADLLSTNTSFAHLHKSIDNNCGQHCSASSITENNKETLFQLIYPVMKDTCSILGSDESYSDAKSYQADKQDGAYAWIVWRHYEGCVPGNGKFIGVTP